MPKTTNDKPLHFMPPSKLTCPTPKHMKRLGLVVLLGGGTQTPEIELLSIPETPSSPKKITGVKSPRMVGHPWHSKRVHVPALWISVFPFSPSRWRGVIHMPWLLTPGTSDCCIPQGTAIKARSTSRTSKSGACFMTRLCIRKLVTWRI